jgi:hypothetical protein
MSWEMLSRRQTLSTAVALVDVANCIILDLGTHFLTLEECCILAVELPWKILRNLFWFEKYSFTEAEESGGRTSDVGGAVRRRGQA